MSFITTCVRSFNSSPITYLYFPLIVSFYFISKYFNFTLNGISIHMLM